MIGYLFSEENMRGKKCRIRKGFKWKDSDRRRPGRTRDERVQTFSSVNTFTEVHEETMEVQKEISVVVYLGTFIIQPDHCNILLPNCTWTLVIFYLHYTNCGMQL